MAIFVVLTISCKFFRLCWAATMLSMVVLSEDVLTTISLCLSPILFLLAHNIVPTTNINTTAIANPTHSLLAERKNDYRVGRIGWNVISTSTTSFMKIRTNAGYSGHWEAYLYLYMTTKTNPIMKSVIVGLSCDTTTCNQGTTFFIELANSCRMVNKGKDLLSSRRNFQLWKSE